MPELQNLESVFNDLWFDYGQAQNSANTTDYYVVDSMGKSLKLNRISIAEALNFFYFNGWELVPVNVIGKAEEQSYFLRKLL